MNRFIFILITSIVIALQSCGDRDPNKNIEEGTIDKQTYTSNEIGWTMEIPKGWKMRNLEKIKENNDKGLKAIEETIGASIDHSDLKNLLSMQKDPFNIFHSTSEPFESEYEGEWKDTDAALKEILYVTFENQGIKADTTVTKIVTIDGIDFNNYSIFIYAPNGDLIMEQIIFGSLINGFDFGVSISSNNEKDKNELLNAFKYSKFKTQSK